MKYTIVIDKQSRANPSSEKKEIMFEVSQELCRRGDIQDEIIVENGIAKHIQRTKLGKYNIKVLKEPIVTELGEKKLPLFEGDNYIYVKDEVGHQMCAEYIVQNNFTKSFITRLQLNTAIKQSSKDIELSIEQRLEKYSTTEETKALIQLLSEKIALELTKKVDGKDLTAASIMMLINEDISEIKFKADKLGLEGYTTINGGFSIDEEGNASIANGAVDINQKGIQMKNGTSIVGGDGMLTNFQFIGVGHHIDRSSYGVLDFIGVETNYLQDVNKKSFIEIYANIPSGFKIKEAYVTIIHQPVVYSQGSSTIYGYSRNLGLYKGSVANAVYATLGSTYYERDAVTSEIVGALGNTGFTPSVPTNNNLKLEIKKSSNIANSIQSGATNRFVIETRNNVPNYNSDYDTNEKNCAALTGRVYAFLDVYGYMNI